MNYFHIVPLLSTILSFSQLFAKPIVFNAYYENREQPPYYLGNSDEIPMNPGVAVEMIQSLEDKISNFRINLTRAPWKRCKNNLENGSTDGIFNASFKKKRLKIGLYPWKNGKVDPSRRITKLSYSLYRLKNSKFSWNGKGFSSLKGAIAAPAGFSIVDDLRTKHNASVEEAPATKNTFLMLVNKRVEAAAVQTVTGDFLLASNQNNFKKSIVKNPIPLVNKDYYLMISKQFQKKHPKLTEEIWNKIEEIRQNKLEKLMIKYSKL